MLNYYTLIPRCDSSKQINWIAELAPTNRLETLVNVEVE